jgi:hypothetical protein
MTYATLTSLTPSQTSGSNDPFFAMSDEAEAVRYSHLTSGIGEEIIDINDSHELEALSQ